MVLRAGLTGGIGSGKSTVARIFCDLGVPVIDTDQIAHQLTHGTQSPALSQIRTAFGNHVFESDGTLSRQRLREVIFSFPPQKQKLEAILHPLIWQEVASQFEHHAKQSDIVVFDIPLLAESSLWPAQLERILVVDCTISTQIQRVIARSGWSEQQVKSTIAQQATREQRLAIATDVIFNENITLDALHTQVQKILIQWH